MHITLLALGSTGDILPYTALGKGLKEAGHQVRFITFSEFESRIQKLGLEFYPMPGDPRALVAQGGSNIYSMAESFGSLAEDYTRALSSPHLLETDLLINQLPGGLFGRDVAEKAGAQLVLAAVIPLAPTREFPMMGFQSLPIPGYNRYSYKIAEILVWGMFRRAINRWRVETLGLLEITRKDYFKSDKKELVLNGFSPSVVERPPDWEQEVKITGYWFPEDPDWIPPDDLVGFLEEDPPPIFIGFGSLPIKDPARTTRIILKALEKTGQRAVLHMGWSGLGNQDLPDEVFRIQYAPYDWLFPRMKMVIHHGGSGTTGFGLRAGVPSCAVPLGFDQVYWGKRIAALEAGPEPVLQRRLNVDRLMEIIQAGTGNQRMKQQAERLGDKIRSEDGIGKAVTLIEKLYTPG
jgi:UDP:flavonoid glycosyltransferase YjiC (YdhE family)